MMSSDRDKGTEYDSFQLRNQWENRAKQFSQKGQQEKERQGKSALNGLYKKWQSRLANENGTATAAKKKGKGSDMSDFRKIAVIPDTDADINGARFKVVPPPKIPKLAPPPPPPPKKKPPKRAKPQVPKPARGWDESWKSLKPPEQEVQPDEKWWRDFKPDRYLPLSEWARPLKCRPLLFSFILHQQTEWWQRGWPALNREQSNKLMKAKPLDVEVNLPGWEDSWKKSKSLPKQHTENQMITETIQDKAFLPGWTESWKVAGENVQNSGRCLRDWHESWSLCQEHHWCKAPIGSQLMSKHVLSDELLISQLDEEIPSSSDWIESWKSVKSHPQSQESQSEAKDTESEVEMSHVPLHLQFHKLNTPFSNWHESWKMSTANNEAIEGGWKGSWKICSQNQNQNDTKAQRDVVFLSNMYKTQRFRGVDSMPQSEWSKSWKTPKPPQHTFLPGWKESWKQNSNPYWKDWRESWSLCQEHHWCKSSMDSQYCHHAMMMSKRMLSNELLSSKLDEEIPSSFEWIESWKSVKPQSQSQSDSEETESVTESEVEMSHVPLHLQFHKLNTPFSNWQESWKVSTAQAVAGEDEQQHPSTEWTDSWKISWPNLNKNDSKPQRDVTFFSRHKTERFLSVDCMVQNEWSECWKTIKPTQYTETREEEEEEEEDSYSDSSKHLSHLIEIPLNDWAESWRFKPLEESPTPPKRAQPLTPKPEEEMLQSSTPSPPQPYKDNLNLASWGDSWKSLKPPQKEVPSEKKWWRAFKQDRNLPFNEWAKPFKCRPLLFSRLLHTQTTSWQQGWPAFSREQSNKLLNAKPLDDEVNLPEWEDAWKTLKPLPKQQTEKHMITETIQHKAFLPGWTESWKVAGENVQNNNPYLKDWRESWSFCHDHHSYRASIDSQNRQYLPVSLKHKLSNELLISQLDENIKSSPERIESWKSLQNLPQPQSEPEETESEIDMPNVPMHLQFLKINTPFSNWRQSWKVSTAESEGEKQQREWNGSWKISCPNRSKNNTKAQNDVFLSNKHKTYKCLGVEHAEDSMSQNEWFESWKTQQHQQQVVDWAESWRLSVVPESNNSVSLDRWKQSWRLSNPNHPHQLNQDTEPLIHIGPKHHRQLHEVELPHAEWSNSWKYLKSDTLAPNTKKKTDIQ
ncbi:uncharacterized protein LOC121573500 isoform X1 [Coregonus clupeaformis]|uniref:uncharacterized protein LOC121573500 isoform X1 n=1 Tax=Coregonus clupeaformis TaxID=59861 RepID=UPI001BE0E694|nr:uncharacterized protein LOC121573500 isoform X1 [Coregonus clupeaformis]